MSSCLIKYTRSLKFHSASSETGTPLPLPPGLPANLTRCSTLLSSRRWSVLGPVTILSKKKRCAAYMDNDKRINKNLLEFPFIQIYMRVGPVTTVLALPVRPLPSGEVYGALPSLTLLLPLARVSVALTSAALGSTLSWGLPLLVIPSWKEPRYSSYSSYIMMGLSAASSTPGRLFPVESLVA